MPSRFLLYTQVTYSPPVTLFLPVRFFIFTFFIFTKSLFSTLRDLTYIATMKFTGLTISLALSGLGYSAALPVLGNVEGPLSSVGSAVGGVSGSAAKIVAPITSTTDGLTGSIKRDDTAALGETVQTIPSLANSAVRIAGSAVGTGESLVSGVAGTAENSVAGAGPAAKRQLNNLVGSTLGSAVPAIIQEAKAGGLAGGIKRDGPAALGETVETIPALAHNGLAIAGSAVGTGESLVSGAAGTAENAVGHN